jgi:hypothetical protein
MISPELGSLPDRFLLAELPDGGVVVDLASGDYLHINKSASTICRVLLDPNRPGDEIDEIARLLGINPALAEQHMRSVLSALAHPRTRRQPRESLQYSPSKSGFELLYDGRAVLHLDPEGRELTLVAPVSALPASIDSFVRQILPRIAFLNGVTVLHGAVVEQGSEAVAIAGLSGAGKSTTAGALIDAGARPIADDLIVVMRRADHVVVLEHAEQSLNAWAAQASRALASRLVASAADFPKTMTGRETRLTGIWFLDRSQRRPDPTISKERLPASRTLLRVLANSFVGSSDWGRHLRSTQHLASTTPGYELTVPDTLPALRAAARDQRTNVASYLFGATGSDDNQA